MLDKPLAISTKYQFEGDIASLPINSGAATTAELLVYDQTSWLYSITVAFTDHRSN